MLNIVKSYKNLKEAKSNTTVELIVKSNYKIKATWNIIKKEVGKVHSLEQVPTLL
jgi:hypothetical protein